MAQQKDIKGYQIQETLGEGGFGTVYRAYQPLIRRDVAIKVIRSSYANQPEFIKRFEAEAQLVARLEHLHIVPLFDFWRDPTGAYLVMRMLRGGSLRDELQQRGRFSLEEVTTIITQISAALSVAHRKGIVHRDLKPANILLDEERNAYLTDFGIAKDVEHSSDVDDDEDDDSIVGTPAYSPPEQLQSLQPTPQSDIYSFGLIIYELLTGHDAMAGDSVSDAIRNQLYEQLPDIDPVTYNIPPMINEILATATAKNPDDRYRDIMHFARDFRHAVSGFKSSPSVTLDKDTGEMVVVPEDTVSFVIDINDLSPNTTTGTQMVIVNPYKGLRAFQESDASDFHGRKDLTEKLIERLNEDRASARFLAVIGPSGSGKSSIVKAGLIPALRDGALPDSENFYVAEMVPSIDALEELESVLLSIAIDPPANLHEQLASSETALFDLLKQILPDDGSELFLLIDQFEEIFTQTEDNAVRTHFMNSLQYAVTHPESRLWAVITIRADFYDKPLLYPKFGELVRERGEIVLPLSRSELEAAIVEPAKSMRVEIEPELIAQIIADVQEEPGALPLLQYALTELFDRRSGMLMTLSSYRESGGVLGSLARRAEELYLEMDEAHQEAIRQMFLRLVTLGEGTEDTRRRVRWSELSFYDGIDDPMANVRDLFTKYRLLTGDNDPQTREPTVEVAHEALIRQWQRLRNWLADNRENIRIQRQVVGAVHEWQQNEQDDSFLATGMRLNQFELLLQNSDIALTIDEKAYIEASIEQREARIREEQKRQAREQALRDRARRFLQLFSATTTIGLIIASGLAIFAFTQQQLAEREAIVNNSISLANLARFWGRDGDEPLLGIGYAVQANTIDNPPVEVQQTLAEIAWQAGARRQLVGHQYEVWSVTYSHDGSRLYSGDGGINVDDPTGTLIEWDAETGEILRQFDDGHTDRIYSIATSSDGQYIATGSQDTTIIIRDLDTGDILHRLSNHSNPVWSLEFTSDSSRLVAGDGGGTIIVWDVLAGEALLTQSDFHSAENLALDISADDTMVLTGNFDGSIQLWSLETGERLLDPMSAGAITSINFVPTAMHAVSSDQNGDLIVWNLETGERLQAYTHEEAALRGGAVITPTGDLAIAADDIGNVIMWDIANDVTQPIALFRGHVGRIANITITPDGNEVATAAFDKSLIIWDLLGRGAEIHRFDETSSQANIATMSSDGTLIATGTDDGQIIIWDAINHDIIQTIASTDGDIYALQFTSTNEQLAVASENGTVTLWDVSSGDLMMTLDDLQAPVRSLTISPDNGFIAGAGGQIQVSEQRPADNRILIWDFEGNIIQTLEGHTATIRSLAFTSDGTQLLSGGDDTTILLWSVETGEILRRFESHTDSVTSLAFSPNSEQFISGSLDTTIIHWDTSSGEVLQILSEHTSGVRALAYHPDGIHAVSGAGDVDRAGTSDDYDLLYWNIEDGRVLRGMPGHSRTVRSIVFNADGTQILSASDDSNVILWHADTLETLLQRISDNYEVVCVEGQINAYCQSDEIADDVVDTSGEILSFPNQTTIVETYAENSLCLLPDNNFSPTNNVVDTSSFVVDAPYRIGYSNGGQIGTSSDWIASWASYQAQNNDIISEFIARDANGDLVTQIDDIQALLDADVDALIINPIELSVTASAPLQAQINIALNANIPVILVGNRLANETYTSYVGHDPYELGCIMGQELVALIDGEGIYGVINAVDLSLADTSFKDGERAVLANYPRMTVVTEGSTNYLRNNGVNITQNSVVDGLLGYTGLITLGAQDGLALQSVDYVPFVTDSRVEIAQFAIENNIEGVFVRSSAMMGATAVDTALAILRGEAVTQFIRVVPELITMNDLSEFDLVNAPINAYIGDWENLASEFYP